MASGAGAQQQMRVAPTGAISRILPFFKFEKIHFYTSLLSIKP